MFKTHKINIFMLIFPFVLSLGMTLACNQSSDSDGDSTGISTSTTSVLIARIEGVIFKSAGSLPPLRPGPGNMVEVLFKEVVNNAETGIELPLVAVSDDGVFEAIASSSNEYNLYLKVNGYWWSTESLTTDRTDSVALIRPYFFLGQTCNLGRIIANFPRRNDMVGEELEEFYTNYPYYPFNNN